EAMPEHLTWFKWESYSTWLSGAALLIIGYWSGAELFRIDPSNAELQVWQAILISGGSLTIGWLVYDFLCKSGLGQKPTFLMVLLFLLLVAMAYGYSNIFTGRATLLHLGAFTATIMSANVFFIIIPNQRVVVDDLRAGRTPDPKYGKIAKLRSTHNNYLTLPVIFLMLSNHYPLAFASEYNWLIAAMVFLMGVTIRHYFNSVHARKGEPIWTWIVTVLLFIGIMWLSTAPLFRETVEEAEARPLTPTETIFAEVEGYDEVHDVILGRCSMCHSREPAWEGMYFPPKGVVLETTGDITRIAREIYIQAGVTHAMPPANVSYMEESERAMIVKWYREGAAKLPFSMAAN
ncbi:MAG TPA: urate hydroxylase PuuD, partial [Paracoccaceae bacterium]|nr:urate hydroxylase PuuD [Paracoccaceae bacterium]